jgi:hypothetical protein
LSPAGGALVQRPGLILAEPPAMYRTRPPLVPDCGVLCAVLAAELKAPLATFDVKLGQAAWLHLAGLK